MIATQESRQLNIKDISIPEQLAEKPKPFFDPAKYLSDLDFKNMRAMGGGNDNIQDRLGDIFNIKIIAPHVFEDLTFNSHKVDATKRAITAKIGKDTWRQSQILLAGALLVMPQHRDKLLTKSRLTNKLVNHANSKRGWSWETYLENAYLLGVIDPEQAKKIIVDERAIEALKTGMHVSTLEGLEKFVKIRIGRPSAWSHFAPNTEDWEKITNLCKALSENPEDRVRSWANARRFYSVLTAATILGAEDVKVSKEKGLELLHFSKKSLYESNSLPQRRRF